MNFSIVCHDAGGAEILSSFVRRNNLVCLFSLAGPAAGIFKRKLNVINNTSLTEAIDKSDILLCGSSWQSNIEIEAINYAKAKNRKTIVFLDHWGNYLERFIRKDIVTLPDEIWVGDSYAESLAKKIFTNTKIELVKNPYFLDVKDFFKLKKIRSSDYNNSSIKILFVSEPLKQHGTQSYNDEYHWGYTEDEGIDFFLTKLHYLNLPINSITIRPHPSENPMKYEWAQENKTYNVIISNNEKSLFDDIADSDIIFGFQSMALVVAVLANKRVISCIPQGGKKSILPYPQIEDLNSLISYK
jgi:hypothetical protein